MPVKENQDESVSHVKAGGDLSKQEASVNESNHKSVENIKNTILNEKTENQTKESETKQKNDKKNIMNKVKFQESVNEDEEDKIQNNAVAVKEKHENVISHKTVSEAEIAPPKSAFQGNSNAKEDVEEDRSAKETQHNFKSDETEIKQAQSVFAKIITQDKHANLPSSKFAHTSVIDQLVENEVKFSSEEPNQLTSADKQHQISVPKSNSSHSVVNQPPHQIDAPPINPQQVVQSP